MSGIIQTNKEELQKRGYKGFTLMEMLIVIAIIAILVAIAIPIFSGQLEKAREATDMANLRAAYASVSANYLSGDTANLTENVTATQTSANWASGTVNIGGIDNVAASTTGWTVAADSTTGNVTITPYNNSNG